MNKISILFAMALTCVLVLSAVNARADFEVSASVSIHATSDFYTPLSACGTWVEVGSYGRCWRPTGVAASWRPYCNGHWEWTDCGWYWVSDEPWAWACYHYGYWVYDPDYGWIWVPGVDWAPAWVCWRIGGDYIGWAPMPPPGHFFAHHAADSAFVFVDANHFNEHITPARVIANNHSIVGRTKYIADMKHVTRKLAGVGERRVIVNEGPGLAAVEKASGRKFSPVPVRDAINHRHLPASLGSDPGKPEMKNDRSSPALHNRHTAPPNQGQTPGGGQPAKERNHDSSGKGSGRDHGNDHGHDHGDHHDHGHD
jgi:Family of unknown function (DUF6600)